MSGDDRAAAIAARVGDLRSHTARGTILNSAFDVGFAVLGLVQRLVVAAFLTAADFGFWTVVLTIIVTLGWLKQLGIADKFIQQDEPDQALAFQRAFTLELATSIALFALIAAVLPLYVLGYGRGDIVVPTLIAALTLPLTAFEAAAWIPYRHLDYLRHRILVAVNPLVTFAVTVGLAIAGAGYWAFIAGAVTGAVAGAVVCLVTCPHPWRLRSDRETVRRYASFSLPLLGSGLSNLVVIQGSFLALAHATGLAGIGAIGLAIGVAAFADRVDTIVSQTLYPAVCAVAERRALLYEVFVKSNRIALMWGLPFGAALALFAGDFVTFFFSEEWQPAIGVLTAVGVAAGVGQLAFNWTVFIRATGDTRPLLVGALLHLGTFLAVMLPAILTLGLDGWIVGTAVALAVQLVVRAVYMRRLFGAFNIVSHFARSLAPVLPGAALVLLARATVTGDRSLGIAFAELAAFGLVTAACIAFTERRLIAEVLAYVRRRSNSVFGLTPASG